MKKPLKVVATGRGTQQPSVPVLHVISGVTLFTTTHVVGPLSVGTLFEYAS